MNNHWHNAMFQLILFLLHAVYEVFHTFLIFQIKIPILYCFIDTHEQFL